MREWNIWVEGYRATGESGIAQFYGIGEGDTFQEAVAHLAKKRPDLGIDVGDCSVWACRLYPSEEEARKAFG